MIKKKKKKVQVVQPQIGSTVRVRGKEERGKVQFFFLGCPDKCLTIKWDGSSEDRRSVFKPSELEILNV